MFPPNSNCRELLRASCVCCGRCGRQGGDEESLGSISSPATNWLSSGYSSSVPVIKWHNSIYLVKEACRDLQLKNVKGYYYLLLCCIFDYVFSDLFLDTSAISPGF